ncbi:MAG TPA: carbamoyltransferase C-terminal domain-containing protein [Candidatus Angelobacter sp.]|nr:carbamoyltransferase C-terminal domain-containing protein [Candidatus Angelobacter sp.]
MNVLGFSGLWNSVIFKRLTWPGLQEREYRIAQGHDAAAALIVNGSLVSAGAEERFNRKKHSELFPTGAIEFCLANAGLKLQNVDQLVHCFDYQPYRVNFLRATQQTVAYEKVYSHAAILQAVEEHLPGFPKDRVFHVDHHLSHAASAYYTSGWDDCAVLVMDGMGEVDSVSAYRGSNGKLIPLFRINARNSIGILYSLVTFHLGFDFNSDEYKIMGLAPYGDPARFRSFFEREIILGPGANISIPMLAKASTAFELETYAPVRRYLNENLIPERRPDDEIGQLHCDVAAALQQCLDRTFQHLGRELTQQTGCRRLAMSGGVALNCTANGHLRQSGLFEDVYIQPAAGDDGAALGAALFRAAETGEVQNRRMPVPFLGPASSDAEIERTLCTYADKIQLHRFKNFQDTCAEAARQIAAGKVIGWFRGRMEFGPRALGNRSILADARHPEMRDRINAMVKKRESFRPFAPAVSSEEASTIFEIPKDLELPYMVVVVKVREAFHSAFPAITHVDGTARVQTVSAKDNPEFHTLLHHVGKEIGTEIVLNTSFNVKGQPIVNTAQEAMETFLTTGIDTLFLGNNCIVNNQRFPNSHYRPDELQFSIT